MSKFLRVGVLGATSQIAKDLIISFSSDKDIVAHLFARRPKCVTKWLKDVDLSDRYLVDEPAVFGTQEFDVILNFVGVGNPTVAVAMGASIFDVTYQYDEIVINYLKKHSQCKYIFLSSGAAYGGNFEKPVTSETKAEVNFNALKPQDWYAVAKLYAECRHRALSEYFIYDLRVFNYFSHTQDMSARFLMSDIIRAIKSKTLLHTSPDYIVRDYITPPDFCQLIDCIIKSPPQNMAIDCYTKAPVDKPALLATMREQFGLKFNVTDKSAAVNATGIKPHYYSLNKSAARIAYLPSKSSLEGIVDETRLILDRH